LLLIIKNGNLSLSHFQQSTNQKNMPDIGKLISGFRIFKATTYQKQKDIIYHLLEQGQKASTLVISCSDIRLSPNEIFATNPGEIYMISNIGGLVPKYESQGIHGILSAIEYAVKNLEVQNIIVLGHTRCDAMKLMLSDDFVEQKGLSESMKAWLSVVNEAREATKAKMNDKPAEDQQNYCEQESLIISMRNLLSYPYIAERMKANKLNIYGWQFNIESGDIIAFNPQTKLFDNIA